MNDQPSGGEPTAERVLPLRPSARLFLEVCEEVQIAAPPERVYAALGQIGQWWSSQHTYSGDAKNLSLELKVGGCFCERLPDGGAVGHMVVDMVEPDRLVRLAGALGPLARTGSSGHLVIELSATTAGSDAVLTYDFGGYAKGGVQQWAAPVDQVLGEQMARLKRYVETGRPDAE